MKHPAAAGFRLSVPVALLAALLQRAPALPVATAVDGLVLASRAGVVLRAAAATFASLGALHSLAGATQVVVSTAAVNGIVGTTIVPVAFATNFPATSLVVGSYRIAGVPPGLAVPGLDPGTGILNVTNPQGTGVITGTPTTAGSFRVTIQAWEFVGAKGDATTPVTVLFTITASSATGPPTIATQPVSQLAVKGQSVTFSVGVVANPAVSKYEWLKDGLPIPNENGPSLTFANVQVANAGNYFVRVTNGLGTVQSVTVTLDVRAASQAPKITVNPQSQTVATGSTVVFTGAAEAVPTPIYQWRRGANPIAGATSSILVLTGSEVVAGSYSLVASNEVGADTSSAATLTVTTAASPSRLVNLSILAPLAAGESMTMGTVIGGKDTSGAKALLARAAGPSLTQFPGVTGVLPDPKMSVVAGGMTIDANDNWGDNATTLAAAFAQVGAFPYTDTRSRDAAIFLQALASGNYTVQVSDAAGAAGIVIAELYDATPDSAWRAATPRLINVSVLKNIATGATLTAGFVIGGTTAKTVLVRAIGPGLAQFNVSGVMPDPKLTLFNGAAAKIAENDNWGGDTALTTVGKSVGAFAIDDAASRDAMLLVTLAPGSYSAAVSPTGPGGQALVEVYEVP